MPLIDVETLTIAEVDSLTIEGVNNLCINESYAGPNSSKRLFRNRLFSGRLFAPALWRGAGEGDVDGEIHTCGVVTILPAYRGVAGVGSHYEGVATIQPAYRGRGDPQMLNELFINDVSRVWMPITLDGEDVDDATVSFEVWTTEDDSGDVVGTAHAMTWDAGQAQYIGLFPTSEAAGLTKFNPATNSPYYWVHITANGITDRRIRCKALYRGAQ